MFNFSEKIFFRVKKKLHLIRTLYKFFLNCTEIKIFEKKNNFLFKKNKIAKKNKNTFKIKI